jgi:secreted PhoX family phosphatase
MTQAELGRRSFLQRAARLAAGGTILAPSLTGLIACNDITAPHSGDAPALHRGRRGRTGYGELVPHPSLPFLIPEGFNLKLVSRAGDPMASGGGPVPNALDGMCTLPARRKGKDRWDNDDRSHERGRGSRDRVRLVRNHEMRDGPASSVPMGSRPYDANAGAGCTTLEVEMDRSGEPHLVEEFVSISGTCVNCAGGPTPWGSWLTCEETTEGIPQGRLQPHGYVFEVPGDADSEVEAVPIKEMGRFSHEALAVDLRFGHVYETEDAGNNSGFYRFVPRRRHDLAEGGQLQMLAVTGQPGLDTTRGGIAPLTTLSATWVDIDDPDPAVITSATSVFAQGFAKGGTRFARLEGCWWGDDSVFFNATSGGASDAGQVWQYRPVTRDRGQLVLIFESPGADVLDSPDNICVSPRGGLVLCEDGGGAQFMRGLTQDGFIFDFVRSANPNSATEFAGACFSPEGETLFFNTQGSTNRLGTERGGTFAIWGPWEDGAL